MYIYFLFENLSQLLTSFIGLVGTYIGTLFKNLSQFSKYFLWLAGRCQAN